MSDDPYRPRSRAKRFKSSTIVGMITTFVMFVALALMMSTYSDSAPDATLPATLPVTLESTSETPEPEKPAESVTEPHATTFEGKVIKIIDGDTIDVLTDDKETIRLRFNGIDTPERGQPFGNNATDFVKDMVGGKMVSIIETDEPDRYGRLIADVYHDGKLINLELVRAGLAWHYVEYAPDDKALAAAELEAREQNAGLWAGSHKVIAPWDWRKLSKVERDKLR